MRPLVSLCIPTNGIIQWVFPVLDSIYEQDVDDNLFEVVVMDNGNNNEFKKLMTKYASKHYNCVYKETDAYEFLSEIETYKVANGEFIKFINHRTKLLPGTLKIYIDFVREYRDKKPIVYFSNGVLNLKNEKMKYVKSFDQFVNTLSYFSSWSTGMAFWKEDFDTIDNLEQCNLLFPHTNILFAKRKKDLYIVDNRVLLSEIPVGKIPKGRYNLFNAFAVEYVSVILELYRQGDISIETFLKVKSDNLDFISLQYLLYNVLKRKCSYDLTKSKESIKCYYSMRSVRIRMVKVTFSLVYNRLRRRKEEQR